MTTYFLDEAGYPVMLEDARNPASRAELEERRVQREQAREAREAAAAERRAQMKAAAGR